MDMTTCPHCRIRVVPTADGICPSCRQSIGEAEEAAWLEFNEPSDRSVARRQERSDTNDRPVAVTIISWFLIVTSGIAFFSSFISLAMLNNPQMRQLMEKNLMPIPMQFILMYLGLTISVVCGTAMLNRMNWGRGLYVIWNSIGFVIGITTSPMKLLMLPGLLVFLLCVLLLFRPSANAYFTSMAKSNARRI